jgi:small subunit ribosomal protein S1
MADIFGDDNSDQSKKNEFAALFEQSVNKKSKEIEKGDKVFGEIISIGTTEVFVALESNQDGVVLKSELLEDGVFPFKVGEHLELFVMKKSDGLYQLTTKASNKALAESIEDAFDLGTPIEGRVTESCNGGYRVSIMGKAAFCPISQIDYKVSQDEKTYIDKKFDFIITKFEQGGRNIVVSRRKALELTQQDQLNEFLTTHRAGSVLRGEVTRLEDYGAFVKVAEQVEALLPISEISFSRIKHPSESVQIGDKFDVKILKIDDQGERVRISVSKKQVESNPWASELESKLQIGTVVQGHVKKLMPFGAFVEVLPGIEGLVPLSEMSYKKRVLKSDEFFKEGDFIPVMVKSIDSEQRRILLSYKDSDGDPWLMAMSQFKENSPAEGVITKKEKFGLMIELMTGVTGLLSQKEIENSEADLKIDKKKVGDKITVIVQKILPVEKKIQLSLSSENDQSWQQFNIPSSTNMGSLGDQFKDLFSKIQKK